MTEKGGEGRMRLDPLSITWIFVLAVTLSSVQGDSLTFNVKDATIPLDKNPPDTQGRVLIPVSEQDEEPEWTPTSSSSRIANRNAQYGAMLKRQGKDLLDWIGLGVGQNIDPYLARTNEGCLGGDFSDCFKSRALNSFSEFFDQPLYEMTENVRVVRMPWGVVKDTIRQPYEYSSTPRSDDTEWDQLVKFAMRKAERFVKTVAFEVSIPSWVVGENEVYRPRFLDEIADEIDVLENKKDTLFSRNRLKRLLIPMLIVLKLFKLKLLLFLPLILGLASFKKFLGFLALVVPGIIGFLKLCKPISSSYTPPIYSPSGLGSLGSPGLFPGNDHIKEPPHYPGFSPVDHGQNHHSINHGPFQQHHEQGPYGHDNYNNNYAQQLAYQGYNEYRSKGSDIMAEVDKEHDKGKKKEDEKEKKSGS